jgi:hypothetical protein
VTSDYCSNSRYFCSDNAPNNAVKLSYCPFVESQCFGKPVSSLSDNSIHTGATTMAFTINSVCAWRIRAQSEYFFNKQIKVTVEAKNAVNCYKASGTDLATADSYEECQAGSEFIIDAD